MNLTKDKITTAYTLLFYKRARRQQCGHEFGERVRLAIRRSHVSIRIRGSRVKQ